MKYILFLLLLNSTATWSQQDGRFEPVGRMKSVPPEPFLKESRFDFTYFMVPAKYYFFQHLQLEFSKQINKRRSLGITTGFTVLQAKLQPFGRNVFFNVAAGYNWSLLGESKFYINPTAKIMYSTVFGRIDSRMYYGGGLLAGINIGYRIGSFGIGVKVRSYFSIGYINRLDTQIPETGFSYLLIPLEGGINLSFRL